MSSIQNKGAASIVIITIIFIKSCQNATYAQSIRVCVLSMLTLSVAHFF